MRAKFIKDSLNTEFGDPNSIPTDLWVKIVSYLFPKDFFSLRLSSIAFKLISDNSSFMWEPEQVESKSAKVLDIQFDTDRSSEDSFYYAAQHGEYRWPGGFLLMCSTRQYAIEVKQLCYNFKLGTASCKTVACLYGHSSPISFLKSFNNHIFISGDEKGAVNMWIQKSTSQFERTLYRTSTIHSTKITSVARTKQEHLVTGDISGCICYWTSDSYPPVWKKDLSKPIVSIKILAIGLEDQMEIVCLDAEKKVFKIAIISIFDGAIIRFLEDLKFDLLHFKSTFTSFHSFINGNYTEYRSDISYFYENNYMRTLIKDTRRININVNNFQRNDSDTSTYFQKSSFFHPSENNEDFRNNHATPFWNGNIIFWKQTGEAKLFYQKRLPVYLRRLQNLKVTTGADTLLSIIDLEDLDISTKGKLQTN